MKFIIFLFLMQLIPRFQHQAAGAILAEVSDFLFFEHAEGFAREGALGTAFFQKFV